MYFILLIAVTLSLCSQSFLLQTPQKQIAVQAIEQVHIVAGTSQYYLSCYCKDTYLSL